MPPAFSLHFSLLLMDSSIHGFSIAPVLCFNFDFRIGVLFSVRVLYVLRWILNVNLQCLIPEKSYPLLGKNRVSLLKYK